MTDKLPPVTMIEIYGGKDPKWKGWYNAIMQDGTPIALCPPKVADAMKELIETWKENNNDPR